MYRKSFPLVPSESEDHSSSYKQARDLDRSHQKNIVNYEQIMSKQKEMDLQDLDIEPIQNKHGDMFYIDEVYPNEPTPHSRQPTSHCPSNSASNQIGKQYFQSQIWPDVFYAQKTIMSLLQERNDVCQMYNLNSKSNSSSKKKVFSGIELQKYVKQVFEESPSYHQYDDVCFTLVSEKNQKVERYFVFFGTDGKFVPQCKVCNLSAYLILNVQQKHKDTTQPAQTQKLKKSALIEGKILCSNTKCKKKLLGQVLISHQQKQSNLQSINSTEKKGQKASISQNKLKAGQKYRDPMNSKTPFNHKKGQNTTQEKKVADLNQKQRILVKKAAMKVTL